MCCRPLALVFPLAGCWLSLLAVEAAAQTVQLPTQQVFSVGTTVMVPDRGSIVLGGVSRARESSVSRGLPLLGGPLAGNRGIGRELSKSTATAHVRIIDLDELDKEVLAAARAARGGGSRGFSGAAGGAGVSPQRLALALRLTRHMGRRGPTAAVGGRYASAEAGGGRATAAASRWPSPRKAPTNENLGGPLQDYLLRAERAAAGGHWDVARRLYAAAAQHASGRQRDDLLLRSRYAGLGSP